MPLPLTDLAPAKSGSSMDSSTNLGVAVASGVGVLVPIDERVLVAVGVVVGVRVGVLGNGVFLGAGVSVRTKVGV